MPRKNNPEKRFWSRVNKNAPTQSHMQTNCWEWTGAINSCGYGSIYIDGRSITTHRYSYMQAFGPVNGGLFVCHRCDVRHCVNPEHLFLGTNRDNVVDMYQKGRGAAGRSEVSKKLGGVRHFNAKLSMAQVAAIRDAHRAGECQADIARQYKVSGSTIHDIVHLKSYLE